MRQEISERGAVCKHACVKGVLYLCGEVGLCCVPQQGLAHLWSCPEFCQELDVPVRNRFCPDSFTSWEGKGLKSCANRAFCALIFPGRPLTTMLITPQQSLESGWRMCRTSTMMWSGGQWKTPSEYCKGAHWSCLVYMSNFLDFLFSNQETY